MKWKGFTQIESMCCTYVIDNTDDISVVDLVFWEKNCKIESIRKKVCTSNLFSEKGIELNLLVSTRDQKFCIEHAKLIDKCDSVNIQFSYREVSPYKDFISSNASVIQALSDILNQLLVKYPEKITDNNLEILNDFIKGVINELGSSKMYKENFKGPMNKLLGIAHIVFDDRIDEIIGQSMRVQTFAAHLQNYLEEVHNGKQWDDGLFTEQTKSSVVYSYCEGNDHDRESNAGNNNSNSNCSTRSNECLSDSKPSEADALSSEDKNSVSSDSDNKVDDTCQTNSINDDDADADSNDDECQVLENKSLKSMSHHSGDTHNYYPKRRNCSSVHSRCSSYASYKLNPKTKRFEITALPGDENMQEPVEILPKQTYAYCEKKVLNIYKLITKKEPTDADLIHYSNMLRRRNITSHDLVCILRNNAN